MSFPRALGYLAVVVFTAFWVACIGIPLTTVLGEGLSSHQLFAPVVLSVARATIVQASISTLISGVLGLFLGLLWMGRGPRALNDLLLSIPYGVPTLATAIAWVTWLGHQGILSRVGFHSDWLYSMKAVILAHVFLNTPLVALWVSRAQIPCDELEAAKVLGARRGAVFREIVWPRVRPFFASACAQVFSLCAMSFSLILVLGGGPPVDTLETVIYGRLRFGEIDFSGASACGIWEILITLLPWGLAFLFQSRRLGTASAPHERRLRSKAALLPALILLTPYFGTVSWAGLARFKALTFWTEAAPALKFSLLLASATGALTLLLATAATISTSLLRTKILSSAVSLLASIPSGISALVLGLGFWLAYDRWLDLFSGSAAWIIALQSALFLPLAYRMLLPVSRFSQRELLEAAASLGSSRFIAFREIEWPRWRKPVLGAFAFSAVASLGELGVVSLFSNDSRAPLPVLIARLSARYRFEDAQAASFLLLLSAVLIFILSSSRGISNDAGR